MHDLLPTQEREKYYQTEKWRPRHRICVLLSLSGATNKEIEEYTGYSASKVSTILNDPRAERELEHFGSKVADNLQDVHSRLKAYANEALSEIMDGMRNSTDERLRQKAAFGILDRAGYTAVQKVATASVNIPKDAEERMLSALQEIDTIDAEYEDVEVQKEE